MSKNQCSPVHIFVKRMKKSQKRGIAILFIVFNVFFSQPFPVNLNASDLKAEMSKALNNTRCVIGSQGASW